MNLKETYGKLEKKYSLPAYSELNRDFDIEDILPETEVMLQKIRGKITEKLEGYAGLIESFVQPDTNMKDMYEARHMDDADREHAYALFKKIMHIIRRSALTAIQNTEEGNASFIKESFSEWNALKKQIEPHIRKLEEIWKKETDIKTDLSYFG
ncbi:TPA: hypothetical protein HA239_04945 [Candidatus Woesearchaeota archaeon]|nr:hypothetical protein QT06_C0001G0350 [archaeon GW2011_AR15]MBS3103666.1 hypothetical protein [Candidatus Woesearchaeota archaeon]HIH41732.1 hypothetical protein [Candidatus Woesearchaeota archaeon]